MPLPRGRPRSVLPSYSEEEGAVVGEEVAQAEEAALVREEGDANGRKESVCAREGETTSI